MAIYTAGFAAWTAEQFFGALKKHGVSNLVDVRLNNTSQLASFAKKRDLEFFLRELCNVPYFHEPLLAPTASLLRAYRKKEITWEEYENNFNLLIKERRGEEKVSRELFSVNPVVLCSEHKPDQCHRRLAVDYLNSQWGYNVEVVHLV